MEILIIGAGAIGCLVGAKLAHSGHSVTFGSRPRFAETLRERGLVLIDEAGRHVIGNAQAAPSIGHAVEQTTRPFDLAILTVKSYDTAGAMAELSTATAATRHPLPPVLSLQNGVGNEETIAATLATSAATADHVAQTILAGVITTPVSVPEPAVIQVDRPSYHLGLSLWQPAQGEAHLQAAATALRDVGFRVRRYPHAPGMKWTKLLMNMMGNALCAILDLPPARLFLDARLADLEIRAWREALRVMDHAGIQPVNIGSYPFGLLAPLIRHAPKSWLRPILSAQVGKARGAKMPSLHMDLHSNMGSNMSSKSGGELPTDTGEGARREKSRDVRSEIDWLNGAVVEQGRRLGVETPVNTLFTTTFHRLLVEPDARTAYRHAPERLLADLQKAT